MRKKPLNARNVNYKPKTDLYQPAASVQRACGSRNQTLSIMETDLNTILEKCKAPFLEQLENSCRIFKLIGTPLESPKWLQFSGMDGTDIMFISSQKANFGFKLHGANFLTAEELEYLSFIDYNRPYYYFRALKYDHLETFHPTIK